MSQILISKLKYIPQHVVLLSLLIIATPLTYSSLLANGTDLPRYAIASIIAILSAIFFLFSFYKKTTLHFNKFFIIPAIVFIWSLLSYSWSLDEGNSFIEIPRFFLSLLVLFLAMQVRDYKEQNLIINVGILACFIVVLIGLLQTVGFNPFNIYYLGLPASTFINPNHASIYIEFFVPILLYLILYTQSSHSKTLYSITLIFTLSFLYVLSSFGTLLSLFFALVFSSFLLARHANLFLQIKNNYKYIAAILMGTIILIFVSTTSSTSSTQQNLSKKPISLITQKNSHKIRLALYLKSLNALKDNPVTGFGYGGFRAGILPYLSEVQSITNHSVHLYYLETHNDFIQQFTELGIIGGSLFITFFGIVLFLGLNSLKNKKTYEKDIFIFAISSGLLVLLLHSFIDFPFHLSASNLLIYISSGLILSTTSIKMMFKRSIKLKVITLFIIGGLFLFLIKSISYNLEHIESSKLVRNTAIALHKERNCNKAIKLTDESNQLFEFDFQNQMSQTQIYGVCPQEIIKQQQVIKKLVNLNPTNFRARYLRGNISLRENNTSAAFKDFYYIINILPNSAIGYIGMGKWAIKTNKFNDARIYLEKAMEFDPRNTEVKLMLKHLNKSFPLPNSENK